MKTPLVVLVMVALCSVMPAQRAAAQIDWSRTYMLPPSDTDFLTGYGVFQSMDKPGLDLESNVGVLQYSRTFGPGDRLSALLLVVPYGEIKGDLSMGPQTLAVRSSGLGDVQLGFVAGLYGAPALARSDYVKYDPALSVGLLTRLIMPTGEYGADTPVNFGANRWAVQLGLPMVYARGDSFIDPHLTTFELLPSAFLYTANHDPFRADTTEQDPMAQVEGHISQNLVRGIWLSADAVYKNGGEMETDGVSGDNRQESLSLGGSVGVHPTRVLSLVGSYSQIVSHNDDTPDGDTFRVKLNWMF